MQLLKIGVDGKIHVPSCELNIVTHCNLSCRSCAHLSPLSKATFLTSEEVLQDLSRLSRVYTASLFRIVGGEPLLHPHLTKICTTILESGIASRVCIVSNGTLLHKIPKDLWPTIKELRLSIYPGFEPSPAVLEEVRSMSAYFGVSLVERSYSIFRETYSENAAVNVSLVARVFSTCRVARYAHTVHQGYFFKCPQSLFLPKHIQIKMDNDNQDRIAIDDSPDLQEKLLDFLNARTPLSACMHCAGSVGKNFSHEQISRRIWREKQSIPYDQLIDFEYLETLEDRERGLPE